jgi:hypothetical protein
MVGPTAAFLVAAGVATAAAEVTRLARSRPSAEPLRPTVEVVAGVATGSLASQSDMVPALADRAAETIRSVAASRAIY